MGKRTKNIKVGKTNEEILKNFPKPLIDAFKQIASNGWNDEVLYKKYRKQVKKYLGDAHQDAIEQGKLIVLLTRSIKIIKEKCLAHPKYKGKRKPKIDCHMCWDVYSNEQTKKEKKEKTQKT